MLNLLIGRDFYDRGQLTALIRELDNANPGSKWTMRTVRENAVDMAKTFSLNGVPIFEVVRTEYGEDVNDLREAPAPHGWAEIEA